MTGTKRYKCPNCEGEFDEPVDVQKTSFGIIANSTRYKTKACPWCEQEMHGMERTDVERIDPEEVSPLFGNCDSK